MRAPVRRLWERFMHCEQEPRLGGLSRESRQGLGASPPSPASMELMTWSSGIKLSLRLLLFWALLPPEVPGKEGKHGTCWSLCLKVWAWAGRQRGTSLRGREQGLANTRRTPGTPQPAQRDWRGSGVSGEGRWVWGAESQDQTPSNSWWLSELSPGMFPPLHPPS